VAPVPRPIDPVGARFPTTEPATPSLWIGRCWIYTSEEKNGDLDFTIKNGMYPLHQRWRGQKGSSFGIIYNT